MFLNVHLKTVLRICLEAQDSKAEFFLTTYFQNPSVKVTIGADLVLTLNELESS